VTHIFVSPTGNDSNTGTQSKPVKTLAGALNRVPATYVADVLIDFAPGTYQNIAPTGSPPPTYKFGPSSTSNESANIILVGKLATAFGPFTTTGDSDPGGLIIPLGGTPTIDQYVGLSFVITASPDASLIGQSRLVAANDGSGNTRVDVPFFTTVPAGTTVLIMRSSVILPYDETFVLQVVGSALEVEAIRFQHTGADSAAVVVDNAGGATRIGVGSEIEFSDLASSAWTSANGTVFFGPTGASHQVTGGIIIIGFAHGAYLHQADGSQGNVFTRTAAFSPSNISYDSSVLKNIFSQAFTMSSLSLGSIEAINSTFDVEDQAHLDAVGVTGRAFTVTRPVFNATDSSEIFALFSELDEFVTDGIQLDTCSQMNAFQLAGTGATGSGYGVRIRNESTNNMFGPGSQTITGDTGDLVFDNNGYTADVPITYAGLTFQNDPTGSACRVVVVL
jgi:hypothetical protein